jgi:hypothetical protein
MTGRVGELRWATQLLRQKGLFIIPSTEEPVSLAIHPDGRSGKLKFVGHHVRLKEPPRARPPAEPSGGDVFASRTDPPAMKIKRLRKQIAALRERVAHIQGFEARIKSIRRYVKMLGQLTSKAKDPFRAITPVLGLELVRLQLVAHRGAVVSIEGTTFSKRARRTVVRWLEKQADDDLRYRTDRIGILSAKQVSGKLEVPRGARRGRARVQLIAAGARAADLATLARIRALVVAPGCAGRSVRGTTPPVTRRSVLAAALHGLGCSLLRVGPGAVMVPRDRASATRALLRKMRRPRGGRPMALRLFGVGYGQSLSSLSAHLRGKLEAPQSAVSDERPVSLTGRARSTQWARLLAAAGSLVMERTRAGGLRFHQPGHDGTLSSAPEPDKEQSRRATGARAAPLARLRVRAVIVPRRRRPRAAAILSAGDGRPRLVRRSSRLGRNRSKVTRIDRSGVTVRWSDGGVKARLKLPLGGE